MITNGSLPLAGIKVVDFTQILAGPFCTMFLADMGADVIKVEKPNGGDDTRRFGPPFIKGESAAFMGINRNKRSVVIDLKNEEGVELAKHMLKDADVTVQNSRPGAMERIGLGYEDVKAFNPKIIYGTVSGFGTTGPYSHKAGFDLVAQGMSGLMSVNGFSNMPPAKVGVPVADLNTGLYSALGILTAYINRLKTGQGQLVDASLLDSALSYMVYESTTFFATGEVASPKGSQHQMLAPYQAFATKDGYINVGAANQPNWERMARAMGREDLLEDPRFSSNAERMAQINELTSILEESFMNNTTAYWVDLLEGAGVPCGPIYNMKQVYEDPQIQARNMLVELEHATIGSLKNIGIPIKLSDTPGALRRAAPVLGQHTDEVLAEYGFSDNDIVRLRESGAVS